MYLREVPADVLARVVDEVMTRRILSWFQSHIGVPRARKQSVMFTSTQPIFIEKKMNAEGRSAQKAARDVMPTANEPFESQLSSLVSVDRSLILDTTQ